MGPDKDHPEEDAANAARHFLYAFEDIPTEKLKSFLTAIQFEEFEHAMDLMREAEEKSRYICDGPTAWGMAAGYREGQMRAVSDLSRLAEREGREDVIAWLSGARLRAMTL